ncbi:MAG TPA: HAD family hydrolase [Candidatus Binatia bacterium]|nr:HAD family hydrolase [Candidatus Binatia bacterium]
MTGPSRRIFPPPPLAGAKLPERVDLVVLDLDGTCLDRDQQLHPRTEAAVREAGARVPVVIATGRPYQSAQPWARRLHVRQPLICYQGALVQAMPDPDPGEGVAYGRLIAIHMLDAGPARRAIEVARAHGWHRQAYVDDNLVCEEDRPEAHHYAHVAALQIHYVDDLEVAVAGGTVKVVCVVMDRQEAVRCRQALVEALGGRARVTPSLPEFIEVASPSAGKGQAIRSVCEHLGVDPARAVAVGDGPNDADLLDAVGFGVAVEGATEELLRHADSTCARPDDAGVADVLEALRLSGL